MLESRLPNVVGKKIIVQHVMNNVGHCTDDEFELNGEDRSAKPKAIKGVPLLLVLWMSAGRKEIASSVSRVMR